MGNGSKPAATGDCQRDWETADQELATATSTEIEKSVDFGEALAGVLHNPQ